MKVNWRVFRAMWMACMYVDFDSGWLLLRTPWAGLALGWNVPEYHSPRVWSGIRLHTGHAEGWNIAEGCTAFCNEDATLSWTGEGRLPYLKVRTA